MKEEDDSSGAVVVPTSSAAAAAAADRAAAASAAPAAAAAAREGATPTREGAGRGVRRRRVPTRGKPFGITTAAEDMLLILSPAYSIIFDVLFARPGSFFFLLDVMTRTRLARALRLMMLPWQYANDLCTTYFVV